MLFMSCGCHAFATVHWCLVVTCRDGADLLALVCDVYCDFWYPGTGVVHVLDCYQFLILAVFLTYMNMLILST